jgi:hypothetical protein
VVNQQLGTGQPIWTKKKDINSILFTILILFSAIKSVFITSNIRVHSKLQKKTAKCSFPI